MKNMPTIPMVSITKLKTFSFIIVFIIYIIPFSAEAGSMCQLRLTLELPSEAILHLSIPLEGRSGCKITTSKRHDKSEALKKCKKK